MDIITIYGWILAWFAFITAILIGWQLYNAININTIIKERVRAITKVEIDTLRQELQDSIKISAGKSIAKTHYNIAQTFAFEGNFKLAFIPYVVAFVGFSRYDKNNEECANCLETIGNLIEILKTDRAFYIPNKAAADLITGLNNLSTHEVGDIIDFIISKCHREV